MLMKKPHRVTKKNGSDKMVERNCARVLVTVQELQRMINPISATGGWFSVDRIAKESKVHKDSVRQFLNYFVFQNTMEMKFVNKKIRVYRMAKAT